MKTIIQLAEKAAHPYQMPISGKWQLAWLKRFVSLIRMEFYKDDILTDAYMAGFAAGRDYVKGIAPVDIEKEVRADIDRQLNAKANETLISSYEKRS